MIEINQDMIDDARARGIGVDSFDENLHKWNTKSYMVTEYVNGDPILDEDGNPVLDDEGNPTYEQVPTEVTKHKITGFEIKPVEVPQLPVFNIINEAVTINGLPVKGKQDVYNDGLAGDTFRAEADIVDSNGDIATMINSTSPLRLPMIKVIDGTNTVLDQVYMDASITNGHLVATGKFKDSGDWRLTEERLNQSLANIEQPWRVSFSDMSFLIAERTE